MEFRFTAQDKKGNRITAQAQAESVSVLVSQLKSQGLLPLQIKRKGAENNRIQKLKITRKRVKLKDLVVFTRQFSSAINSGLLLTEALETICEDLENHYFSRVLKDIIERIRAGSNFSKALSKYPNVFSKSYVAIIKSGEESGNLGETSTNLTKYLEDTERLIQKIRAATHYPIFLIVFSIIVVSLVVFVIIPKFKLIFAQLNFQLPLLTRIVVGISEMVIRNLFWIILFFSLLISLVILLLKNIKIRFSFDRNKLKIVLLGKVIKKLWITRFCRTLSILVSGGVGLASALPISSEVANNLYLKDIIGKIRDHVISGTSLSNAFKYQGVFPGMLVKMIQVGEKSGRLSDALKHNAEYYEQELEATLNAFTALIEPLLIVFIGMIVAIIVVAFYLPIFQVASLVK